MKKVIIIISCIILALIIIFFSCYFILTAPKNVGKFSVSEFKEYIENEYFQTDINYGKITDSKSAASAGKTAIYERFENSKGNIFEWMGCDVWYDIAEDAYRIRIYHLCPMMFGGAYDVIIKSDGTVLSIWGEE